MKRLASGVALVLLAGCGGGGADESDGRMKPAAARPAAAAAATLSAADQLMNVGEASFPQFFPAHKATQAFPPFQFRFYPETGIYLGVVVSADPAYQLN